MSYSVKQVDELLQAQLAVLAELEFLRSKAVEIGESLPEQKSREYMLHGVAYRLYVLHRCIENVFRLLPPSTVHPLALTTLNDVQINLHSFVINLYGVFENWAWSFVFHHNLESNLPKRCMVGLFQKETQKDLPTDILNFLQLDTTKNWHEKYLKNYRDALAHRIPLYIPPKKYTPDECIRHSELDSQKWAYTQSGNWEEVNNLKAEQDQLGSAGLNFQLAIIGTDTPRPMLLHPQMLSDAKTVVEFGKIFLEQFHERAPAVVSTAR